jgi:hypothetical protein
MPGCGAALFRCRRASTRRGSTFSLDLGHLSSAARQHAGWKASGSAEALHYNNNM